MNTDMPTRMSMGTLILMSTLMGMDTDRNTDTNTDMGMTMTMTTGIRIRTPRVGTLLAFDG